MLYFIIGLLIGLFNYFNLDFIYLGELIILLIFGIRAILLKNNDKKFLLYFIPIILFIIFLFTGYINDSGYHKNIFKNILKYIIILIEGIIVFKCFKFKEKKYSKIIMGFLITCFIMNYFQLYKKFDIISFLHLMPWTLWGIMIINFIYRDELNTSIPLIIVTSISIVAQSRTNMIIGIIFIMLFFFDKYIKNNSLTVKNLTIKAFFILVIFGGAILGYRYFADNITEKTASNVERSELIDIAIEEFNKAPIIGVGIGNYNWYAQNKLNYSLRATNLSTHNLYLELLAETGIMGLGVFSITYVVIGKKILNYKNMKTKLLYYYLILFYFFNTFSGINRFVYALLLGILVYEIEINNRVRKNE